MGYPPLNKRLEADESLHEIQTHAKPARRALTLQDSSVARA